MINKMVLSVLFFSSTVVACRNEVGLFITLPTPMEALSGSCLHIPCNFKTQNEEVFKSGKIFGVWIKRDSRFAQFPQNVFFNSSRTNKVSPMAITGNLKEKNCSTLFVDLNMSHEDTYYFRIESDRFRATANCDPLQINIK
ncbi:hypothetical protein ATANTOWER_018139, partial [Ataeniobius toweri]|nr:hypothetical protein [Ataeniobius toweri]